MKYLILLFCIVLIKTYLALTKGLGFNLWTPLGLFGQDIGFFISLAILESRIPRFLNHILFLLITVILASSFPVMNVLSTPVTLTMLLATSGTLINSLAVYISVENICGVLFVLVGAGIGWKASVLKVPFFVILAAPLFFYLGTYATLRSQTVGMHMNPVIALLSTNSTRNFSELREIQTVERLNISAKGYNVVLIGLESTGAQYLKTYGAKYDPMPFLDSLASESSLIFENAYAVYPESIKGLYSVICSRYPDLHSSAADYKDIDCSSLAEVLSTQGYGTNLLHSGRFHYLGMNDIVRNRGYATLEDAAAIEGEKTSFGMTSEFDSIEHLLNWTEHNQQEPFFIHYLPVAGHHPYSSPPPYPFPQDSDINDYRNSLNHADHAVERLIEGFKKKGFYHKTIFIFYGDHAQAFGQHKGNFAHSLHIYEENIWVPLIIHAPGVIKFSQRLKSTVSLIDVAPSILDLLEFPIPDKYDGKSVLSYKSAQAYFFTDYSISTLGLRDGNWKFIIEEDTQRVQLFNLQQDRLELVNLSKKYPIKVRQLKKKINRWKQ